MNKELIYDPFYQRNFVWSPIHQKEFIKTIILGYTCPEIFIAEGELDLETHIKYIHVIDGQQRLRTIASYFGNKLEVDGKKFKDLSEDEIVEATEDVVKMKGKLYKIFNDSINLFFSINFPEVEGYKKKKYLLNIDLFCGAGGMSEGILQAGFHIIYSNDINVDAATKGITSMGEHLKNAFKDEYYSIGTDCYETEFLAYDSKSDSRKKFKVKNKSQSSIAFLLNDLKVKDAWIDLHKVKENKELNEVLSKKQRMINIVDEFRSWYSYSNKFYTLNMEPCNAYDAIIFIDSVKPVNILK